MPLTVPRNRDANASFKASVDVAQKVAAVIAQAAAASAAAVYKAQIDVAQKKALDDIDKKAKENDCNVNSAGLAVLCVFAVQSQADDYGKAAFDSCMSGAPN